jgi:hypothetical protein
MIRKEPIEVFLHLVFNATAAGDNIAVHREDILHRKGTVVTGCLDEAILPFFESYFIYKDLRKSHQIIENTLKYFVVLNLPYQSL